MDFRKFVEVSKFDLDVPDNQPVDDSETGYKTNIHTRKVWWAGQHMSAVGILPVVKGTGLVGVVWRSPQVHLGNCYGLIGGAVEDSGGDFHSNLENTIKQEMGEEVGYYGPIENLTHLYTYHDYNPKSHEKAIHDANPDKFHQKNKERYWKIFKYYNFVGMIDLPFEANPEEESAWEVGNMKWVSIDKLFNLKLHPGLKEVLMKSGNKLINYIKIAQSK